MKNTYAAIDIGSNTIQMQIDTVEDGKTVGRENYLRTVGLGAYDEKGALTEEKLVMAIAAFKEFAGIAAEKNCKQLRATATSAVRDAANQQEFLDRANAVLPVSIEVLSGKEEARYSYAGAKASVTIPGGTPVIDLGGNSTEWIRELNNGGFQIFSMEIGAVRAKNNGWDREKIDEIIAAHLTPERDKSIRLIGVGGCITTIAAVLAGIREYDRKTIEAMILQKVELMQLRDILKPMSVKKRCAASPLLKQRGDIIYQGLEIWLSVMERVGAKKIIVSGGGILDGLIADML